MIGIGAKGRSADDENIVYIYNIIVGSPADVAGIVNYDVLKRVILADGTIVDALGTEFASGVSDIMYPPEGTVVTFDVLRDGKIVTIPVVSKGPKFLNLDDIK